MLRMKKKPRGSPINRCNLQYKIALSKQQPHPTIYPKKMALHYRVLNKNDRLPKDFTEDFRILDELYCRPPPGRAAGNWRAPPPLPSQYHYELPYQQPWMGFRNQVLFYPRERYDITSTEAAQKYGGVHFNELPSQKA